MRAEFLVGGIGHVALLVCRCEARQGDVAKVLGRAVEVARLMGRKGGSKRPKKRGLAGAHVTLHQHGALATHAPNEGRDLVEVDCIHAYCVVRSHVSSPYGIRVIPNMFCGLYLLIDSTSHVILQRLGHLGFGIFG